MDYDYINLYVEYLGYGIYDDTLTKKDIRRIESKATKLIKNAKRDFDKWLKDNNYKDTMGMIYKERNKK